MRPGGAYRQTLDKLKTCGLNGIVQPAPDAVHMAADLELQAQATGECCAFNNNAGRLHFNDKYKKIVLYKQR